jgi:hypothetical protein
MHHPDTVLRPGLARFGERQPFRVGPGVIARGEATLAFGEIGARVYGREREEHQREERSSHG